MRRKKVKKNDLYPGQLKAEFAFHAFFVKVDEAVCHVDL